MSAAHGLLLFRYEIFLTHTYMYMYLHHSCPHGRQLCMVNCIDKCRFALNGHYMLTTCTCNSTCSYKYAYGQPCFIPTKTKATATYAYMYVHVCHTKQHPVLFIIPLLPILVGRPPAMKLKAHLPIAILTSYLLLFCLRS